VIKLLIVYYYILLELQQPFLAEVLCFGNGANLASLVLN